MAKSNYQYALDAIMEVIHNGYDIEKYDPKYKTFTTIIEKCITIQQANRFVMDICRYSTSPFLVFCIRYMIEEKGVNDFDDILVSIKHEMIELQNYLICRGAVYPNIKKYKSRIKNSLNSGCGYVLYNHPECREYKLAEPYVKRHSRVKSVLTKYLNVDVFSVIIEYVLYEK